MSTQDNLNNSMKSNNQNSYVRREEMQLIVDGVGTVDEAKTIAEHEKWGNKVEFLLSCIVLSVGLGNIWRFPFVAHYNGGGAFILPYIIVVLVVGRPMYYMEILVGQFSGRAVVKAIGGMVPCMKGVGYGQIYVTILVTTYYACIMALTVRYLILSFNTSLPWATCAPEWGSQCINRSNINVTLISDRDTYNKVYSSAELFFTRNVLKEKNDINDGIGAPKLDLVVCLLIAWIVIGSVVIRGVKSSGKVVYILATLPYVILLILLGRVLTLEGSWTGIIYFLVPQMSALLDISNWFQAIIQVLYSFAICNGSVIMYSSYNNFRKPIYRDVTLITIMSTSVSLISGCIIFGSLGNLSHEINDHIRNVIKPGIGLAFISYPEAMAKFQFLPQFFSVLFFLMLFLVGVGSCIGMLSAVMTVIRDQFGEIPHWLLSCTLSLIGFLVGLIYVTPGGQFMMTLVDSYCCTYIALFFAICEVITVTWIYGVKRFCHDIEFMLNKQTQFYWRICWAVVAPCLLIYVYVLSLWSYHPIKYKDTEYPAIAYDIAWILWVIGVGQLPFWMLYTIYKQEGKSLFEKIRKSFQPSPNFVPSDRELIPEYINFMHHKHYIQRESNGGN